MKKNKIISLILTIAMLLPGAAFLKPAAAAAEEAKEPAVSFEYGRGRKDIVGYSEEDINKWINKTIEVESINGKEKYKGIPVDEIDTAKELQKLAEPGDIVDMKQVDKQSKSEKLGLSMSAYAADSKTVTVTPGAATAYGTWTTNHFTANDGKDTYEAFCAQPRKPTPRGTFTAYPLNNIALKYAVWAYEQSPTDFDLGGGVENYASAHAIFSYMYSGDTTGLGPNAIAAISGFANALTESAQAAIARNPQWLSNVTLWVAPNAAQDIIWVEEAKNGYGNLVKSSANTEITNNNSCYDLAGAQYTVYTDSGCKTVAKTVSGSNAILTCKSDGTTNTLEMEKGTYYVKETKAGKGYALDPSRYTLTIKPDETTTLKVKDAPQADPIPILLQKLDKEHKSKDGGTYSTAGGTLKGAQFKMTYKEGNRTWVWETNENGFVRPAQDKPISGDETYKTSRGTNVFPIGHYTIQEVKAPEGYLLDDTIHYIEVKGENNVVNENGETITHIHTFNEDVAAVAPEDQIKRGDIQFDKKTDDQEPIANCPFIIIEKNTGEAHVIVTDPNGIYDSSAYPHTSKTNANDKAITWKSDGSKVVDDPNRENDDMVVDESKLDYEAGTWFGNDANNKSSDPADTHGAFPYSDNYQVREIRSSANEGYSLIGFGVVNIALKSEKSGTIHLGTKTDEQVDIRTTAHDKTSGTQTAYADTETTVVDKVEYYGLKKNETYIMRGALHLKNIDEESNVTDGGVLIDVDGKEVTQEKEFTASGKNGYVNLEFTFNSSALGGKDVVVFEKLFAADGKTEIKPHDDIEDNDQTVKIKQPEIETTAKDGDTKSQEGTLSTKATIIDTVKYEGLKEGKTYTMKGVLHIQNKDEEGNIIDGGELKDAEGNPITAEQEFKAGTDRKDKVDVKFEFDSTLLIGKTVVVFEDVERDGFNVATHADITDDSQSIDYPEPKIGTTLTDKASGEHEASPDPELVLVDTIKYENLPIGVELTFSGVLMDKETGEPFMSDGKVVSATTTKTLEEKEGTVDVEFKFSSVDLDGKVLVAFENVAMDIKEDKEDGEEGEKEDVANVIAFHEDLNDVDQTVEIKPIEVKTTATSKDGDSAINPTKDATIVDTVKCSGLIVGKEYTVTGKVYEKETGKAIDAKGATTFTAEKADEEVKVTFTFDASKLAGKTLVVGEDLYRQDKKVATHFDLEDRAQAVTVNKTTESGTPIKTGDMRMLLVVALITLIGAMTVASFKKERKTAAK